MLCLKYVLHRLRYFTTQIWLPKWRTEQNVFCDVTCKGSIGTAVPSHTPLPKWCIIAFICVSDKGCFIHVLEVYVVFLALERGRSFWEIIQKMIVSEWAATATTASVVTGVAKCGLCFNACWRIDQAAAITVAIVGAITANCELPNCELPNCELPNCESPNCESGIRNWVFTR